MLSDYYYFEHALPLLFHQPLCKSMVVEIASNLDTRKVILEPPRSKSDGLKFSPLWSDHLRSPLRMQLAGKRPRWDNLPEAVRGSVVRSCENGKEKDGGFHKVGIEVVLNDASIIDAISNLEDHVVRLCVQNAFDWWPNLQDSALDCHRLEDIFKGMMKPVCQEKVIEGAKRTVVCLELRPWDIDPPRIIKAAYNTSTCQSTVIGKGDVTDIHSGSHVIPIITVPGMVCKSSTIRLVTKVTELLVYAPLSPNSNTSLLC